MGGVIFVIRRNKMDDNFVMNTEDQTINEICGYTRRKTEHKIGVKSQRWL